MDRAPEPFLGYAQDFSREFKMATHGTENDFHHHHLLLAVGEMDNGCRMVRDCGVFAVYAVRVGMDSWDGEVLAVAGAEIRIMRWLRLGSIM